MSDRKLQKIRYSLPYDRIVLEITEINFLHIENVLAGV
ncbi:hypothetical protein LEP1GSC071_3403 [Leptospira santarosai str. JET]|nr:hypothetical protein LEP1GSC071_3403 [Leptospira santarosai str. JET]